MKITNKYNFPESIVRAVENDPYTGGGDISVTRLIAPAQQVALQKLHADDIEEDVSDRIWSLIGQAVHHVVERSATDFSEIRVSSEILGWNVSGQFDHLSKEGVLTDYKITSVWTVLNALQEGKEEWEEQLNLLAQLIKLDDSRYIDSGKSMTLPEVEKIQIVAICRDWSKTKAMTTTNYPKQSEIIEIDLWPEDIRQDYLEARVAEHQQAQLEGKWPPCSNKEKWTRPDKFAVMKGKNKRAVKLFDSKEEAEKMAESDKAYWVQDRPGEDVRCESYCNVRPWCPQKKEK